MNGLFSALFTGGLVGIGFFLVLFALSVLLWYMVIKTAVRNGMIEALKKTGNDGFGGGGGHISGYPPAQTGYGAPPAPGYSGGSQYPGYGGPNG